MWIARAAQVATIAEMKSETSTMFSEYSRMAAFSGALSIAISMKFAPIGAGPFTSMIRPAGATSACKAAMIDSHAE